MAEYIFKLKKGELELEVKSDDATFIATQMELWRAHLLAPSAQTATTGFLNTAPQLPSMAMA